MPFKFEKLEVWQLAVDYLDLIYKLANQLPFSEEYNLKQQIIRAATSIALNIAEGSTSQSNAEQTRFLRMAIRPLIESVACLNLSQQRNYYDNSLNLSFLPNLIKYMAHRDTLDRNIALYRESKEK